MSFTKLKKFPSTFGILPTASNHNNKKSINLPSCARMWHTHRIGIVLRALVPKTTSNEFNSSINIAFNEVKISNDKLELHIFTVNVASHTALGLHKQTSH